MTEHPYRKHVKAELDAITAEVLDRLDEDMPLPVDEKVIEIAYRKAVYRRAFSQACMEGHRFTAWMILRLMIRG
jgi:hypothetical protein